MLPHGPDKAAYDHATKVELKPVKLTDTLAFMFETRFPQHLTKFAAELETLQEDYADCWTPLGRIPEAVTSPARAPTRGELSNHAVRVWPSFDKLRTKARSR